MAMSNSERIGKGLELLRDGLVPFVEREMKAKYAGQWKDQVLESTPKEQDWTDKDGQIQWDAHRVLLILWNQWNNVFKKTLGQSERTYVSELREIRNKWAHQNTFTYDDTYRALDTMSRLLRSVSAAVQAPEVEKMAQETMRVRFAEQARQETRRKSGTPIEGTPPVGLKPWREVVTPHPDVATGRYHQAEFAADLEQVRAGDAISEYGEPREFFRRTFLTVGLTNLLKEALLRVTKQGGEPVVELQTNFGGGKTHSMLALFHLFSGISAIELTGVDQILHLVSVSTLPNVKRATLVGTALNPGQPHIKEDGTRINTLWGELAWQLGGREGYALVVANDNNATSPGSQLLCDLFKKYNPCLILIDEWVAYVRQTYGKTDLSGGSFDSNMTFAQALTEASRATAGAILVASLPASNIEIGGEGGQIALDKLKNTFGRMESPWRPASAEESFEIVRRRLFEPITDPKDFAARDAVIKAFGQHYRGNKSEFPQGCGEAEYERRFEKAYPIHPELFDRLYEDWGSLEKFQRTRGVLRLMATVIAELWDRQDSNLLIMPATVPMDAPIVQSELTRYLGDNWRPVMEKDVDGPEALSLKIDRAVPTLGRYSAARRVTRTIYMGSAPLAKTKGPGIDDRRIRLGCVQPGESVATFGDALRRLTDQATHLYVDGNRYWFSDQPSVIRLAQDRGAQQDISDVWAETKRRLRADRQRAEFSAVHIAPESTSDVPDEMEARLVMLDPEKPHSAKAADSQAMVEAEAILNQRGNSQRIYKNMLVFLAPDKARLNDLEQAIRNYLAWDSIWDERESLNLDAFQTNQSKTKRDQADETVLSRIKEAYSWLLVPLQPDPQKPIEWQESRLQGQDALAVRAVKRLKNDENLITEYSATRLRLELDRYLWKDTDHLNIRKLWEYFATYLYLPRLKDSQILIKAVHDGVESTTWFESFAYAEGWDHEKKKYLGLKAGQLTSIVLDSYSLVVKPEAAQRQLDEESEELILVGEKEPEEKEPGEKELEKEGKKPVQPKRFHGSVKLDATRLGRDAGKIAEEVVQHLSGIVGADVEVTLEISAQIPDGAPEHVVRTVTENCNTLGFLSHGFERE
jgi:predicted AAA+ superfamily ATPase